MKKSNEQRLKALCDEVYEDIQVDVWNCISHELDNIENFDDVVDEIENNNGFDIDIIYYHNAMEYLTENDTSLRDSFDHLREYGYTLDNENLSSELLASIHATATAREEIYNYRNAFDEILAD
jgi:hypothetical protein